MNWGYAISIVLLFCFISAPAQAQRALDNTGFEGNDPQGPGAASFEFLSDAVVPGWNSETGTIELWDDGFQSVPAHSGDVFAEMNAKQPGTLHQNICIENGETVNWSFAHRARPGGAGSNPQIAVFQIAETDGTVIQTLATQSTPLGAGWRVNSGTAPYLGAGGLVRVQFKTTNPGSFGNFLDSIVIDLAAYVEFHSDTAFVESSPNRPHIVVNGTVGTATNVPFTITGGTATLGEDYTQTASFVTVPPGVYNATLFELPITIIDDGAYETLNETITFQIGTPSTSELKVADATCGPTAKTTLTHTIIDNDPNVTVNKTVDLYDPLPADGQDVFALPGNDVIYTFTLENSGHGPVDADSIFLVDALPEQIIFYNGDIDGIDGPETNPVAFSQSGAGLTFNYASHVGFSTSTSYPTSFADCDDTPSSGYDDSIRHICFAPAGMFSHGPPSASATLSFRAQIK